MPNSLEAEQAVLGALLTDPSLISAVADKLKAEHFFTPLNRDIYSTVSTMYISGIPIDIITVINETCRRNVFDTQEEAVAYLKKLADLSFAPSSLPAYAKIIEDKALVRQILTSCNEVFGFAAAEGDEPNALLDFAESTIYSIRNGREINGLLQISPTVMNVVQELSALSNDPNSVKNKSLSTSFKNLDLLLSGLNRSDLIVIAARPSMGKTAFAVNMATNIAKRTNGQAVAIFSLEMSREQLVTRMLSTEATVDNGKFKSGMFEGGDWPKIADAAAVLTKLPLYIDDTPNVSITEMKAKLRRTKNLGLVVIDYLQLMSTNRRDGNRVNEISEITRNLKILAKELNVPVILLSQLSRDNEKRPGKDKRPFLSDLRDSGSIEQDADVVMFLHREYYYDKTVENPNLCECIVAKNRHGSVDRVPLEFRGEFYKFTSVDYAVADNRTPSSP